jgi:DNA-binding NtrC family response regulator
MPRILVIDDDRAVLHIVQEAFKETELEVKAVTSAAAGIELLADWPADVLLLDIMLPGTTGLQAFEQIREMDAKLPIIFITAGGTSSTAIEAMKLGAYDYVLKPLDLDRLRTQVQQALEMRRLMRVPVALPDAPQKDDQAEVLVGQSPGMLEVYKAVGRVASQDVTILILGESGTGKELIARAIYHHSARAKGPFLAVNCAALPDSLLESELFGHEKGSFTGADRRRIGKFEQCHGGTIFLDEIGDMSPLVQGKVLRLLQQQEFERVGGTETIKTDVRIITATNRDLEEMVTAEKFRADLYYRLNGYSIRLPPLRERGGDVELLLDLFLNRLARQTGKDVRGFSPAALELLKKYPWPGNVRELQGAIMKALLQAKGPMILPDFLPEEIVHGPKPTPVVSADGLPAYNLEEFLDGRLKANSVDLYAETLAMMEGYLITRVLRITEGNQSKAAKILGITRGSLRTKIHSLGISIGQTVQVDGDPSSETVLSN